MGNIRFIDDNGTFTMDAPEETSLLYLPSAGEKGLKSCFSPDLGGDAKTDQEHFLLEPVCVNGLSDNRKTRNFWCITEKGAWSACGSSAEAENDRYTDRQDKSRITAGFMWQRLERTSDKYGLSSEITSYVKKDENTEVMEVRITNRSDQAQTIEGVSVYPIYGRSADNIRDHRNVTSMLHRIETRDDGIVVSPTMSFDERGHRINHTSYFVKGEGARIKGFYPTEESFLGEGGTYTHPAAIYKDLSPVGPGQSFAGKEVAGAIRFLPVRLAPGESRRYIIQAGVGDGETNEPENPGEYWERQVNVSFHTGNGDFDRFMKWVAFQPILRRIYGCSFLPYHDYGRGGRGWRDLWQDCLSLLIMNPKGVREQIINNIGGVRTDGTNATIIGEAPGEFVADRNGISRVWMDHAMWPFITVRFYIDQTGDRSVLFEEAPYFADAQIKRGYALDSGYDPDKPQKRGSLLEHLLIEHLCAYFDVGDHQIMRLRGADWNDALDMASEKGESVAFTAAYAGNLRGLSELLSGLTEKSISLAKATGILLSGEKREGVLEKYYEASSDWTRTEFDPKEIADDLIKKADALTETIRRQEWLNLGWYNSYYDNSGRQVEGEIGGQVRMMLTGQVFTIASGVATDGQVESICESADRYLFDGSCGGYRLNTDFGEIKSDLGRMFGFAYGEKENGAVFSHMAVMYANALYKRGFVREGYKALKALYDASSDFSHARQYPGIPEYFDNEGRGKYQYLTGAASWYLMTIICESFGVRGEQGRLVMDPKLVREQFDKDGIASISLCFAGQQVEVTYVNKEMLDYGEYRVTDITRNTNRYRVTLGRKDR